MKKLKFSIIIFAFLVLITYNFGVMNQDLGVTEAQAKDCPGCKMQGGTCPDGSFGYSCQIANHGCWACLDCPWVAC